VNDPTLPRLFATAAKGTEGALRDELRELGFVRVRADRGGVHFDGDTFEGLRACLSLRTAVRVLTRLASFDAPDGDALYEGVRGIDWSPYLSRRHTLAVRSFAKSSALVHTQFIAQKTKDAIVDQLRDRTGARPSVDLADPDVSIFVHLANDRATVYLDLAGEPLHRRGYRADAREAPLKENLAAAILRLGGWDRERPLLDPMCGSGTIALEAALWAQGIAPGTRRDRFGVERWANHDAAAAARAASLRGTLEARARPLEVPIFASDADPGAVESAQSNARAAGVSLRIRCAPVRDVAPTVPPGHVVTNPPYGERLASSGELYEEMARAFARLAGHRVTLLAGSPAIVRPLRWKPASTFAVYNGDIECRLLTYEVRERRL
jgi:23S rRNA G2445 N2-methylase RlmL